MSMEIQLPELSDRDEVLQDLGLSDNETIEEFLDAIVTIELKEDWMLFLPFSEEENRGGVIISRSLDDYARGLVLAVGDSYFISGVDSPIPTTVEPGDKITYKANQAHNIHFNGKKFKIMRERLVIAKELYLEMDE